MAQLRKSPSRPLKCSEEHRTKAKETNNNSNCETSVSNSPSDSCKLCLWEQSSIDSSEDGALSEDTSTTDFMSESSFCVSSDDELEDSNYSSGKQRHGRYDMPNHTIIPIESNENKVCSNRPCVLIFGFDISHFGSSSQYMILAICLVSFTVCYGLLQELVSVTLMQRQLALFIATIQLASSTFWSYLFHKRSNTPKMNGKVPYHIYFVLSVLRAIDLGMTNLSMQFLNYPTKTLLKSSRVVFTMITGIVVGRKKYLLLDYVTVSLIVIGLAMFLHADSMVAVAFHPSGIALLMISLTCDGIINNWSELAMNKYNVGQDEFLCRLYSIALFVMLILAHIKGELMTGIQFLTTSEPLRDTTNSTAFTSPQKILIMVLFSTTGNVGASCAAAISKRFGALITSITGTGRKAMTLFLSFAVFHNECTLEHIGGILIFLSALLFKSVRSVPNKSFINSGLSIWSILRRKTGVANKSIKPELACSSCTPTI